MRTFALAARHENKTRFATDSKGHRQKRQRIGSPSPGHREKREMRQALLASPASSWFLGVKIQAVDIERPTAATACAENA
jgi:hypothetical protein